MKIYGIKCVDCGHKDELWPGDPCYVVCEGIKNFELICSNSRLYCVCGECGGDTIKWDLKDNDQCWSFGDTTMGAIND